MAKTKNAPKGAKKLAADADVARKIWLAGVGAYDKMYNETQAATGKLAKGESVVDVKLTPADPKNQVASFFTNVSIVALVLATRLGSVNPLVPWSVRAGRSGDCPGDVSPDLV